MSIFVEMDSSGRIKRVIAGERPDFIGDAAKISSNKEAKTLAGLKHGKAANELDMCHVVAWSIITKRMRRIFKGATLEQSLDWLEKAGNWPDGQIPGNQLLRRNASRAANLSTYSLPTKELLEQWLDVWMKAVNSWTLNLWLGPSDRNQAKGRMLKNCINLIKRASTKSESLYLGPHGKISCWSGDSPAEMTINLWGVDCGDGRTWPIGDSQRTQEVTSVLKDLFAPNDLAKAQVFVIRASMARQKLVIENNLSTDVETTGAICLLRSGFYYKVSRHFEWGSFVDMCRGEQKLNESHFGDKPFDIPNFNTLSNYLLFSAIDIEADVATMPGVTPSQIPDMFVDGYGHYLSRLQANQAQFGKK